MFSRQKRTSLRTVRAMHSRASTLDEIINQWISLHKDKGTTDDEVDHAAALTGVTRKGSRRDRQALLKSIKDEAGWMSPGLKAAMDFEKKKTGSSDSIVTISDQKDKERDDPVEPQTVIPAPEKIEGEPKDKEPEPKISITFEDDQSDKGTEDGSEDKGKEVQSKLRNALKFSTLLEEVGMAGDFDTLDEEQFKPVHSKVMEQGYEVLSEDKMLQEYRGLTDDVMDFLSIPNPAIAAQLLRAFQWNRERLYEQYVEDPERASVKAGLPSLSQLEMKVEDPEEMAECLICMDDYKLGESFALPCGHRYCAVCWKNYLQVKVGEGPGCISATCMAPKCKFIVHEAAFRKILDDETFKRYYTFLLRSFVEDNPNIKWCPAPGCGSCIRVENRKRVAAVVCGCGLRYCFQCNSFETGDHLPASCAMVEKWQEKEAAETANVSWLISNTKKCPQCRSPIEKNGGCMHMTCNRNSGGCGHEFCWLCRGPWSEHGSHTGGFYACNKYEQDKDKYDSMVDVDGTSKSDLERYMFYFHRYDSHREALKIAIEQQKNAEERSIVFAALHQLAADDTLKRAATQIVNNRRCLQWSYVLGFFLAAEKEEKLTEVNLYEYLQEDLEKYTNFLSEVYERKMEGVESFDEFSKWLTEIRNYTRLCENFLDNFEGGILDGGLTVTTSE